MTNSYTELLNIIGKNIKKYRKEAGLTQTQLGLKLGKTKEYIYMIEKGVRNPSLKTLAQISDILNKPLEILTKNDV